MKHTTIGGAVVEQGADAWSSVCINACTLFIVLTIIR